MEIRKITDSIFFGTQFNSCNSTFIVTKDGAVVVDTPMVPAQARAWKAEIEKHTPVKYVIIQEAHTDHYCGSCYLGGTVIGNPDTVDRLQKAKVEDLIKEMAFMAPDEPKPDSSFYFRPPEIVLKGDATLRMGDRTIEILRMPGHTPQQTAVYIPDQRTVIVSDNINLASPIFVDAVPYEWLKSLDRLNELDVDIVIPGHGEVTDKSAFANMKGQIQTWLNVIGKAVDAGASLEETFKRVNEAKEFARVPKEGPMAGFFKMNVESLHRALKK